MQSNAVNMPLWWDLKAHCAKPGSQTGSPTQALDPELGAVQSYGGGRDLWGLADTAKDASKGWKAPIFNDGLFEVGWPAVRPSCSRACLTCCLAVLDPCQQAP